MHSLERLVVAIPVTDDRFQNPLTAFSLEFAYNVTIHGISVDKSHLYVGLTHTYV
jgi:hypothetical protein